MLLKLVHYILLRVTNEAGEHRVRRHLDYMSSAPVVGHGCLGVSILSLAAKCQRIEGETE